MGDDDDEDLRSRSDARRDRKAAESELSRLAEALVGLSAKQRATLELPDLLEDAIDEVARMPNPRARARQLRTVRRELRELDHRAIAEGVEVLLHPDRRPPAEDGPVDVWLARMVGEEAEEGAIEAFMSEHPQADRQRLRTLTRNVLKAAGKRRQKARRALRAAIAEHLAG